MNYSFLPEAEAEYIEAVRFYEEQQAKLGESLIHEFERIIALIIERPEAWRLVQKSPPGKVLAGGSVHYNFNFRIRKDAKHK